MICCLCFGGDVVGGESCLQCLEQQGGVHHCWIVPMSSANTSAFQHIDPTITKVFQHWFPHLNALSHDTILHAEAVSIVATTSISNNNLC